MPGKMSNFACTLLKTLLFTSTGHNLASGIFISLRGGSGPPRPLFAKLGVIIADEKALKELFAHKGAIALKFCARCQNVLAHNMSGAADGVCVCHLRR